jgi:formylmethanofuran dehydrogenase subunit C
VSERVTLALRQALDSSIEVDGLTPDRLVHLSGQEIARLPVWRGGERLAVGDVFDVRGSRAPSLVVEGAGPYVHGLGRGMAGGDLLIDGDAGHFTGAGMSGGVIIVKGSVGDDGAAGMSGGAFEVTGQCGDRLGAARPGESRGMTGGEIIVRGHAGRQVAAGCRRGLVVVGGNVGAGAAQRMIAGSLFVFGAVAGGAGQFNKRGSLVAFGDIDIPASYRYACAYRPPHIRVTLMYLARRHSMAVDPRHVNGVFRRFCGDALPPGKGEILVWAEADRVTPP